MAGITQNNNGAVCCLAGAFVLASVGVAAVYVLPPIIEMTSRAVDPIVQPASKAYSDKVRELARQHP